MRAELPIPIARYQAGDDEARARADYWRKVTVPPDPVVRRHGSRDGQHWTPLNH